MQFKKYTTILVAISLLLVTQLALSATNTSDVLVADRMVKSIKALSIKDKSISFGAFIDIFAVTSPHPNKDIQNFIEKAKAGDIDLFGLISFFIWRGHAGFHEDKLSGKFGMFQAVKLGSAQAAFFIATSFMQSPTESDKEKIDNALTGLEWLGIASGMDEERAYKRAVKWIQNSSKGDLKIEKNYIQFII